jgi:hypothetical protein
VSLSLGTYHFSSTVGQFHVEDRLSLADLSYVHDIILLLVTLSSSIPSTTIASTAEITTDKVTERPATCLAQACSLYSVVPETVMHYAGKESSDSLPTIFNLAVQSMSKLSAFCVSNWAKTPAPDARLPLIYHQLLVFVHGLLSHLRKDRATGSRSDSYVAESDLISLLAESSGRLEFVGCYAD